MLENEPSPAILGSRVLLGGDQARGLANTKEVFYPQQHIPKAFLMLVLFSASFYIKLNKVRLIHLIELPQATTLPSLLLPPPYLVLISTI